MPEILVLEVVRAHQCRFALGLKLTANGLEIPDQPRFLVSTLITSWPCSIARATVSLMCANCASRSG